MRAHSTVDSVYYTRSAACSAIGYISNSWASCYIIQFKQQIKQHSSCTARSSFFTERVANIWNSLPVVTDFSTLSGFIRWVNGMYFLEFRIDALPVAFNAVFYGLYFRLSFYGMQLLE